MGKRADAEFDWIDDAFDESKEDPLANKGMTGKSSLAVLLSALAVIVIVAVLAFAALVFGSLASAAGGAVAG